MAHKSSICTMSLGRCFAGHSLPHKLDMAQKYGFQGLEVFYEDLVDLAKSFPGGDTPENQLAAARTIRQLCDARNLDIICIQPFMHFGGLVDRAEHRRRLQDLQLWFQLAHILGTDLILFPSSFLSPDQVSEDLDLAVADFTEAAEMGLQESPCIKFAMEALCWGTRIDTWEASWDLVQRVDRPNFGLCLDTYNILGRIYADPASPTGKTPDFQEATVSSVKRIISDVDVSKLFLVQVADGERLEQPLDKNHAFYNAEQPTRMSWSRNARLFYGEPQYGGYMPVKHVLRAIVHGLGFEGWLSFEVFNRRLADTDKAVPEEMARRSAESFVKMTADCGLRTEDDMQPRLQAML
ncbi:xylose isomerase-like protein [Thelonectria olida]|uniref:Xylose isomerase-like protein n=1 Tax=Thelonectria olida TaxID=1576542 RepID=A0A9P9AUR3_9HYPO|nr:xylose isomerase-like protein [Thelonectria olida]